MQIILQTQLLFFILIFLGTAEKVVRLFDMIYKRIISIEL